ncbi:MAG: hypothetical protein HGA53_08445, partial [Anaerolineaceae bacterium]|nr:hypothetical protein [Anaerolineaceae bacterium]
MKIYHVSEMLALEQEAITRGISSEQMVRKAGLSIGKILIERYGHLSSRIVTALIGPKNNGNDTLIALSALIQAGWQARAY